MKSSENVYILHLETSTRVCSVAISKNGILMALEEIAEDGYAHGEMITILIERAIIAASIKINDLHAVSVSSGPGSYTGLRIGTATAKGICFAMNIPLLAVDSLEALIQIAKVDHPNTNLCALIDARRMEVYSKIVDCNNTILKDISADIIEVDSYKKYEPFVYFGDGASKLEEMWSNQNCTIDPTLSSAKGQCIPAYEKYMKNEFEDLAYFEPFYLKDFIAGKPKKDLLA